MSTTTNNQHLTVTFKLWAPSLHSATHCGGGCACRVGRARRYSVMLVLCLIVQPISVLCVHISHPNRSLPSKFPPLFLLRGLSCQRGHCTHRRSWHIPMVRWSNDEVLPCDGSGCDSSCDCITRVKTPRLSSCWRSTSPPIRFCLRTSMLPTAVIFQKFTPWQRAQCLCRCLRTTSAFNAKWAAWLGTRTDLRCWVHASRRSG